MVAFGQRSDAQEARQEAEDNAHLSQTQAAIADESAYIAETRADSLQSLSLTESGKDAIEQNQFDLGVALILEANRIENAPLRSEQVLYANAPYGASYVFTNHAEQVDAVTVAGHYMLSGDDEGIIILWDLQTKTEIRRFLGHTGKVKALAFSADGRYAISGDDDNIALVWDVETGNILYRLEGHEHDILDVAISRDGTWAVTASRDQSLIQWDLSNGKMLRRLTEGHTNRITSVAISPNSKYIVSGSADQKIVVWDAEQGQILKEFTSHSDGIVDMAFSPDGTRFISFSGDNTLVLWDAEEWTEIYRRTLSGRRMTSVAFSPNGEVAILGAGSPFAGDVAENVLMVWDVNLGQVLYEYWGHDLQITDVAFLPDGRMVSASSDTTLRLWPQNPLPLFWSMDTHVNLTAFATQDDMLITAYQTDAERPINDQDIEKIYQFSAWQYMGSNEPPTPIKTFGGGQHTAIIHALAISDKYLLSAGEDRRLILWDLATFEPIRELVGHTNQVNALAFLPNGNQAISASQDRTLILWDLETGEPLRVFEALHTNSIDGLAINTAGTQVISASADRTLILWDIATGEDLRRLRGHESGVTDVVFRADGQTAFSASQDQTIIQWDLATGEILVVYEGHSDRVESISLSANNGTLLSTSRDQTVGIWDLNANIPEPVARLSYYRQNPIGSFFMNDNQVAMIASAEGKIALIPISTEAFMQWLEESRYIYALSCDDRTTYLFEVCANVPTE